MTGVLFVFDLASGPLVQFPALYALPTAHAAWYGGRRWAFPLAVVSPALRVFVSVFQPPPWSIELTLLNFGLRIVSLLALAYVVDAAAKQWKRVKVLEGLLSICGHCKRIRTTTDQWQPLERYITEHSEARFSHGVCPVCMAQHYGETLSDVDGSGG